MLNGISGNTAHSISHIASQKVKNPDIKTLIKGLKNVKNDYKNLLSAVSITGKFEVNKFNKHNLENIYKELTKISNQAKDKKATMDAPNYLFNLNKSKLNQLEKLRTQANKLKLEISKRLNDDNYQTVQNNIHWANQNDPEKLAANRQQQAQRQLDMKNN